MDNLLDIFLNKENMKSHKVGIVMTFGYNLHSLIHRDNILDCMRFPCCKLTHMMSHFIDCSQFCIFGIELMMCILNIVRDIIGRLSLSLML